VQNIPAAGSGVKNLDPILKKFWFTAFLLLAGQQLPVLLFLKQI
jgi:hypothetical protein